MRSTTYPPECLKLTRVCENLEPLGHLYTAGWGDTMGRALGKSLYYPLKLKTATPNDPAIPLLVIYAREMGTYKR